MRISLALEGFQVTCAENAEQALSLAKSSIFDLYILDNWMPDMGGEALCQSLREFDSITPILFYSGAASESDVARALAGGAQGYVTKPADSDVLVSEILRLLPPQE
jgi:DNA-binding response OmpR family regulator